MLRADRNAAVLAGLICAPRTIQGLGVMEGIKGRHGTVLTAKDFDVYNRGDEPAEELTVEKIMSVLGRKV